MSNEAEASSNAIPSYCQTWSESDRFNVACLCSFVLHRSSWSGNYAESLFKKRFLTSLLQHLEITDDRERNLIVRTPYDNDDSHAVKVLADSFNQRCRETSLNQRDSGRLRDVRKEILSDLLLISIGLSQKVLENAEQPTKASKPSLKERLDKRIGVREDSGWDSPSSSDASHSSSPLSVKLAVYDARARAILFCVAQHLEFSSSTIVALEKAIAQQLYFMQETDDQKRSSHHEDMHNSASQHMNNHEKRKRNMRWLATGAGVVVGATLIGLTGGLAAPLVAAGVGAVTGVVGVGVAATATTVALITSLFGIAGGGLGGYKMHRRMQGLKEFSFTEIEQDSSLPKIPSLHVTIVISGYLLNSKDEITSPWLPIFQSTLDNRDTFAMTFDSEILLSLGEAFRRFIAEHAVKVAASQAIQHTVFATLASALFLPLSLAKAGDLIDNPWALGADRASKAGLVLAEVLMERVQGKRPTKLIGYSLGALVIWACLEQLAKKGKYGLIDSVLLIGAPVPSKAPERWKEICSVVSRRVVNVYATNDIVLGMIYRMHSLDLSVAGLEPVQSSRVENVDATEFTSGHLGYRDPEVLQTIIKSVGLD